MYTPRAFAAILGLVLSVGAWAQVPLPTEPAADEPADAVPELPPLDEGSMPGEAARLGDTLTEIRTRSMPPRAVLAISDSLTAEEAAIGEAVGVTRTRVGAPGAAAEVRDARAAWASTVERLRRDRSTLEEYAGRLERDRRTLDDLHARWTAGVASLAPDAPETLSTRATQAVADVEVTRTVVAEQTRLALESVLRLATLQETAERLQEELDQALRQQLFVRDSPPLWAIGTRQDTGSWLDALGAGARSRLQEVRSYAQRESTRVGLQVFLFAVGTLLLIRARRLPEERRPKRDDPTWRTLLDLPVSSGTILALGIGTALHPWAPSAFLDVLVALAVVPLIKVVPRLIPGARVTGTAVLLGLYIVNRSVPLLAGAESIYRLALVTVDALALAGAIWILVRVRARQAAGLPVPRPLRFIIQGAAVAFGAALAANVFGLVALATLIVDATIEALYVAVILWTSLMLWKGVVRLLVHTATAQRLGMVRHHGPVVEQRLDRLLDIAVVVLWGTYVLFLISAVDVVLRIGRAIFDAGFTVGKLHLSLGSLLAFVIVVWLTASASRLARFVLEEDVLPRMRLPKGVPSTVSKLTHYVVLTLGVFVALAAAGVEMSQFAFLAGAVGVGIGFGLQTVVNNFVSGLILLFERPIQEGDVIEVGALTGTVQHIGIRACRVRTFDGAEVIVPNANLISNDVVNWTLTDRVRRFDLVIGVAYGTHPERVLGMLRDVTMGVPGILPAPKPFVTFEGFGASSIDFKIRAWAPYDEYTAIRSELAVRVEKVLREAGIEIPFPQQDLNIRSIDPRAAQALRSDGVAAVDDEGVAGDPDGVVGGEEQGGGGDVGGPADAA